MSGAPAGRAEPDDGAPPEAVAAGALTRPAPSPAAGAARRGAAPCTTVTGAPSRVRQPRSAASFGVIWSV